MTKHQEGLLHLFHEAPINQTFAGIRLSFREELAIVYFPVTEEWFHGAMALHGGVYMKALDDAAYFAAALKEPEHFLLTAEMDTSFLRPVGLGSIEARGRFKGREGRSISAEASLYDAEGILVGTCTSLLVPGKSPWQGISSYAAGFASHGE